MNEPIADAARSILDGHVVLTRSLAHAGHYPAIDVLQSVSRLLGEIVTPEVVEAGQRLRAALAVLAEKEDLVAIGAYQPGTDRVLDAALAHRSAIEAFLRQRGRRVQRARRRRCGAARAVEVAEPGARARRGRDLRRRGGAARAGADGARARRRGSRDPPAGVEHLMGGAAPRGALLGDRDQPDQQLKNGRMRPINRP